MARMLDIDTAYWLTTVLVCLSISISNAELLALTTRGDAGALFGGHSVSRSSRITDLVYAMRYAALETDSSWLRRLLWLRMAAALLGMATAGSSYAIFFLAVLVATQLVLNAVLMVGVDGSDQMTSIIIIVVFAGLALKSVSPTAHAFCLYFIGAQSCLSYCSSGVAKLVSAKWRSGGGLRDIMNGYSYGHSKVSAILDRIPGSAKFASWGIIAFQISFPVSIFLPTPWNFGYLLLGMLFHLFIAFTMALNLFFPAFIAAYPAVVFIQQKLAASF